MMVACAFHDHWARGHISTILRTYPHRHLPYAFLPLENVILPYRKSRSSGRTLSTGHGAWRTIFSATLPSSTCFSPV